MNSIHRELLAALITRLPFHSEPCYGKMMKSRNGTDYSQNYDLITKWLSAAFKGETLEVLGLKTGNKLIGKDRLRALWEEIKMLDILEIAKEEGVKEGLKEGKDLGMKEGKDLGMLEAAREMVVDALIEKFAVAPAHISQKIRAIQNSDALKALFRQIFRCEDIRDFENILNRMMT